MPARSHGMSRLANGKKNSIYMVWENMWARCRNVNHPRYCDWGGRGITVCERWRSFEAFFEDMYPTYRPGRWLDREDNEGDYTPDNCVWINTKHNGRNRRTTKLSIEDVHHIRHAYAAKINTQVFLAKKYNVSESHIRAIIAGDKWR